MLLLFFKNLNHPEAGPAAGMAARAAGQHQGKTGKPRVLCPSQVSEPTQRQTRLLPRARWA